MEKRSRRRTRDLVTQPASQGLSQNEIGCVRISMMAKSMNALFTGRIQKRKTNPLHHSHLACNTRPVHTVGSIASILPCVAHVNIGSAVATVRPLARALFNLLPIRPAHCFQVFFKRMGTDDSVSILTHAAGSVGTRSEGAPL